MEKGTRLEIQDKSTKPFFCNGRRILTRLLVIVILPKEVCESAVSLRATE